MNSSSAMCSSRTDVCQVADVNSHCRRVVSYCSSLPICVATRWNEGCVFLLNSTKPKRLQREQRRHTTCAPRTSEKVGNFFHPFFFAWLVYAVRYIALTACIFNLPAVIDVALLKIIQGNSSVHQKKKKKLTGEMLPASFGLFSTTLSQKYTLPIERVEEA